MLPTVASQSDCCFLDFVSQFYSLTFSVKHLGDVQELLSHLEGGVQVTDGVILQTHRSTVNYKRFDIATLSVQNTRLHILQGHS